MQGKLHSLLLHHSHQQAHRAYHNDSVAGLDRDDHIGELLGHADAQELHARLHHTLGRVAIATHNAVAERAVVHADADGRVVLLTYIKEGHQLGAYLLNLLSILLISVGELLEGACRVHIVTRIDAHLLGIKSRHVSYASIKVHVGHERSRDALTTQPTVYLAQVLCLAHALRGEAHILATGLNDTLGLLHRALGVGSSCSGH